MNIIESVELFLFKDLKPNMVYIKIIMFCIYVLI